MTKLVQWLWPYRQSSGGSGRRRCALGRSGGYTAEEAIAKQDELASYDALVFGAPTYMGSVSAGFMAFMDASSKSWYV